MASQAGSGHVPCTVTVAVPGSCIACRELLARASESTIVPSGMPLMWMPSVARHGTGIRRSCRARGALRRATPCGCSGSRGLAERVGEQPDQRVELHARLRLHLAVVAVERPCGERRLGVDA